MYRTVILCHFTFCLMVIFSLFLSLCFALLSSVFVVWYYNHCVLYARIDRPTDRPTDRPHTANEYTYSYAMWIPFALSHRHCTIFDMVFCSLARSLSPSLHLTRSLWQTLFLGTSSKYICPIRCVHFRALELYGLYGRLLLLSLLLRLVHFSSLFLSITS